MVATATVHLPDGSPLPAGSGVVAAGRGEPLVSGFGGVISIAAPRPGEVFEARWSGQSCRFTLGEIDPTSRLPALGPYTCRPAGSAPP
jgi:outer membrane usher protein